MVSCRSTIQTERESQEHIFHSTNDAFVCVKSSLFLMGPGKKHQIMPPLRGRTVTIALVVLLAYSSLRRASTPVSATDASASASRGGPGGSDDDDDGEDRAFQTLLEDEALAALLNGTERLEPREYHLERHRVDLSSINWRQNRKKITELTTITSVKDGKTSEADANADGAAGEAAQEAGAMPPDASSESVSPRSTLQWLSERWRSTASRADGSAAVGRLRLPPDMRPLGNQLVAAEEGLAATRRERRRRWMAHGTQTLCTKLQQVHGIVPGVTWGSLPANQRRADTLRCDAHVTQNAAQAGRLGSPRPSARTREQPTLERGRGRDE